MIDVTASIVLYNNDSIIVNRAIESFMACNLAIKLYLIDNSPTDRLKHALLSNVSNARCEYIFNNTNLGFGKGHNIAIRKALIISKYHLILNPDVFFEGEAIDKIFEYMEKNTNVGQLMPKILYPNDEIQYSGKLLPTPLDLVLRRVFKTTSYAQKRNSIFELRDSGYDQIMNVPNHLGCFMFTRVEAFKIAGLFDERLFMYNEDVDITRRIHQHTRTIFYPSVSVYHHYEKGSHKNVRLLFYHLHSTITYFNKWGWIFDKERKSINKYLTDLFVRR